MLSSTRGGPLLVPPDEDMETDGAAGLESAAEERPAATQPGGTEDVDVGTAKQETVEAEAESMGDPLGGLDTEPLLPELEPGLERV